MKSLYKMYSDEFLRRILRMIEIFTSVTRTSAYPLSMVQRVANPYMILSLLECLTVASPRAKLIVMRIIKSLVQIGIPMEVFQSAGELVQKNETCASHRIMKSVKLHPDSEGNEPFSKTYFLQFFYKFMVHIRSSMWSKNKI